MANRVQLGWRVSPPVRAAAEDYIDEKFGGKKGSKGDFLEYAILNALPDDVRDATIETLPDTYTPPTPAGGGEKNKNVEVGSKVKHRTEEIAALAKKESGAGVTVPETTVENIIGDVAGDSRPTLRQYKQGLKRRRLLFEDPRHDQWWTDPDRFAEYIDSIYDGIPLNMFGAEYGKETTDWLFDFLPDDNTDPTFQ